MNAIFNSARHACPRNSTWIRNQYKSPLSYLGGIRSGLNANVPNKNKVRRWRKDASIVLTTPVATLISAEGMNLHWITIVDMIENKNTCSVVYQEYGSQETMSCSQLVLLSLEVGLKWAPALNSYTVIQLKNETNQ
jgi:hypothetical protein